MMRPTRRQLLLGAGAGALIGGGYIWSRFRRAVATADRRIAGRSSTIATPFGTLEYAIAGSGPPLLMIHGTGGGFDQGLRFAEALKRLGHRIIAPSRFGYLRSSFPADPSLANQSDALATLLDHLAIDRLVDAGGSAGALSATAFALRHPDRCSALVLLVPAANVDGADPVEMSALQETAVRMLLTSDFAYWSALNTAPETLIGTLLATDPALLAKVSQTERARLCHIVRHDADRRAGKRHAERCAAGRASGCDGFFATAHAGPTHLGRRRPFRHRRHGAQDRGGCTPGRTNYPARRWAYLAGP
ncbi:MAG: alpha/beta hydrolase [Novosphingobium sp.]